MKRNYLFQSACRTMRILPMAVLAGAYSLILLAAILTGCSNTDVDGLPDDKQPMTFTALLDGLTTTRATTDNKWEGSEEVAVEIGNEVKKYTANANGKLTVANGVAPWYWTSETKAVLAWYPYNSGTKPTAFTVETDQSSTGYQASDLIYAAATIALSDPTLTFHHLPAKVVVNLKAGDGITPDEVQNATVSILGQCLISGTINTDWSVVQAASGSNTIIPNALTTPADGYYKSVQALVVPQKNTTAGRLVSITIGRQEFVCSTALDLAAGKQYTYNITVAKNGITVTASGAALWTGHITEMTSKKIVDGYTANDLKIGDYYYSDGTWSDGGYRKYTDGVTAIRTIMPVLTDASGKERTVIGIVYWVGDITGDDALLKSKFKSGTRGLVVALKDIDPRVTWGSNVSVNAWTNATDRGASAVDITVADKMQGYSNTQALTAYNKQQHNSHEVFPIAAIAKYAAEHSVPAGSSGWYFPSIKELKYIGWGQGNNTASTSGASLLKAQFEKVSGAEPLKLGVDSDHHYYYWSSSESPNQTNGAPYVYFGYGNVYSGIKNSSNFVRSILAF